MATITVQCGKCDGKGKLSWTRNADGVCFVCGGSGQLTAEESTVLATRSPRANVIAVIKANLDRMAIHADTYGSAFAFPDETLAIGWALAHADADVHARALAALARFSPSEVELSNVRRAETDERAKLVAGVRKLSKNFRAKGNR